MKKRVLIVDDDQLVADTLSLVFRANGFDTETRYSAAEGLKCALAYEPGLAVLDVTMPERTGLQLAEDVDRALPDCRILMLTAFSSNIAEVEQAPRLKHPVKVMSKPCRPEELLREAGVLLMTA